LGAFVVGFTLLTWAGDGLWRLVGIALGAQPVPVVAAASALIQLIPSVLIMSLQIALLAVAFQRASELAQMPKPPRRVEVRRGIALALVCAVLVTAQSVTTQNAGTTIHTIPMNSSATSLGVTMTLSDARVGTTLDEGFTQETTDRVFMVVNVAVESDTKVFSFNVTAQAGGHTYPPYGPDPLITTTPGFRTRVDYIFEIAPADLDGPVYVLMAPSVDIYVQKESTRFAVDPAALANVSTDPVPVDKTTRDELP